ncbi:hypothetical protein ALC53_07174, partial [Atta colombica]
NEHMSPYLHDLRWLKVSERRMYFVRCLTSYRELYFEEKESFISDKKYSNVSEQYDHAELSELPARDFIARWHEHAKHRSISYSLIHSDDLCPGEKKEEENVVARRGGGDDGGEGEGTRVRFCLSVPVRSP